MPLKMVNVAEEAARLTEPFSLIELAYVDYFVVYVFICYGAVVWHRHILACLDDFVLRLSLCIGESHWHKHEGREEFLFVQEGVVELGTEGETVSVRAGEMTVVPKCMVHRLAPGDGAVVMLLESQVPTSGGR
jgi:mannose-6-phosphate isomerase-like protein (cupin superfamily)